MAQRKKTDARPAPPAVTERGRSVDEAESDLFDLLGDDLNRFDPEEDESQAGDNQDAGDSKDADADDEKGSDEESDSEDADEDAESEEKSDEEDEESDEEDEDTDDETYTVKVDGKDETVTLDELTKGYSRQSDYTRKTQQLAEDRRSLEGELVQTRESRIQYGQQLQNLEQLLEQATPKEPDWDRLHRENPDEYAVRYVEWQRHEESKKLVATEKERVLTEAQAEQGTALTQHMEEEKGKLAEAIPEWADAEKGPGEKQRLADYLQNTHGYSKDQLSQVIDHRILVVARKAMLYDELTTKGRAAIATKKKKAKALKPGQPKPRGKGSKQSRKGPDASRKRLSKSGSIGDAAAALLEMEETEV